MVNGDNGDNKEKELYNKNFKKCPVCGSEETIAHEAWLDEIDAGRVPQSSRDLLVASDHKLNPLIDPAHPPKLTTAALEYIFDVCAECGTLRCSSVQKRVGVVGMQPPGQGRQGPMGGMMNFGRGN